MDLKHAAELLDAKGQGRYFTEPYKLYGFTDETTLKDYLDFVIHEPVQWFRGLPSKLVTRGSFAKPKTALINLLKEAEVVAILEEEYIKKVHDVVWATFKSHADAIVEKRIATKNNTGGPIDGPNIIEQIAATEVEVEPMGDDVDVDAESVHSVHSVRVPRTTARSTNTISTEGPVAPVASSEWERRYRVLEAAYRDLIIEVGAFRPGLASSITRLLDGLSGSVASSSSSS